MKPYLLFLAIFVAATAVAQEREVPKDSERLTLRGCAKGRAFIVGERTEDASVNVSVRPGQRFRMNGPKKILNDIKARERTMVEITGLVRKSQVSGPGGVSVAGGRVRIGGGVPQAGMGNPATSVRYNEATIDLEGYRSLPEPCDLK